jgi:twitching motility two-component system response regulator PilH
MANILIVDDSPTYQLCISQMLHKHGHTCHIADNGEEGIIMTRQHMPDLVLMDIIMPGMNGFQATRTIKKHPDTHHIPVVIVSTKDQESNRAWGLRQGACDYVNKPVIEDEFLVIINKILNRIQSAA